MKPLIVLLSAFIISILFFKITKKTLAFELSAKIAMAIMLVFTAIGHFAFTKGMAMMIPPMIPFKTTLIYLTGIFEILMAICLLIPKLGHLTGWVLILFFVLMLPANIYASFHEINYQKGTFDGHGLLYLWFRIPLQVLFIVWVYLSSVKSIPNSL